MEFSHIPWMRGHASSFSDFIEIDPFAFPQWVYTLRLILPTSLSMLWHKKHSFYPSEKHHSNIRCDTIKAHNGSYRMSTTKSPSIPLPVCSSCCCCVLSAALLRIILHAERIEHSFKLFLLYNIYPFLLTKICALISVHIELCSGSEASNRHSERVVSVEYKQTETVFRGNHHRQAE